MLVRKGIIDHVLSLFKKVRVRLEPPAIIEVVCADTVTQTASQPTTGERERVCWLIKPIGSLHPTLPNCLPWRVQKEKITIKVGTEERVIENLSPYHVSIAYYTVKVTGSLAYDGKVPMGG